MSSTTVAQKHLISSTVIVLGERRTQLAMCGASLGSYEHATAAGHVGASYVSPRNVRKHTDCSQCLDAIRGKGSPITIGRLMELERELS